MIRVFFVLLLLVGAACSQQKSQWKKFEVDSLREYLVPAEDRIYDMSFFKVPNDTIRAALTVMNNGSPLDSILITYAKIYNDTLKMTLTRITGYSYHEYSIFVANKKYLIKYRQTADVIPETIVVPLQTKLILNTEDIAKGDVIRGYSEFKGKFANSTDSVLVKGNFKVIIR